MNERHYSGGFLIGVIAGGIIGALLGVSFAPSKGEENRKAIKKKLGECKDGAEPYVRKMSEDLGPFIEEIQKAIKPLISEAKKEIEKTASMGVKKVRNQVTTIADIGEKEQSEKKKISRKTGTGSSKTVKKPVRTQRKRLFRGVKR